MGDHFLPRFYLKAFAKPREVCLWVYEKGKKPKSLPICKIANENELYGDIEPWLANEVEAPANDVISKIRNYEPISKIEKSILSAYIYVMYKRVPSGYRRYCNQAPFISQWLMGELEKVLGPNHPRLLEAKSICERMEKNPSREVWQNAVKMKGERSVTGLSEMTWTFVACKRPDFFIVGDNPVFFHSRLGINKPESDLTFPLSSQLCFLATWWQGKDLEYVEADSWFIKEMNRRAAHSALRFLYSGEERPWISKLLNNKHHEINKIAYHYAPRLWSPSRRSS